MNSWKITIEIWKGCETNAVKKNKKNPVVGSVVLLRAENNGFSFLDFRRK